MEDNSEDQNTQGNGGSKLPIIPIVISVVALLVIGVLAVTLKDSPVKESSQTTQSPPTESAKVSITKSGFTPQVLRIRANTQVTWTNSDKKPHHIASDPHPTHSNHPDMNDQEALNKGDSYAYTFEKAGTYTYHDHVNPKLTGTIIVE
jgi:plastocyanin